VTSGYLTALDRGWNSLAGLPPARAAFIRWATGGRASNRAPRTQPAAPAGPHLQLLPKGRTGYRGVLRSTSKRVPVSPPP
jgi:hypothetical protein